MRRPIKITIIGGCGHVGLPLGIAFANCTDCQVTLLDVDKAKVDMVNQGKMPFVEKGGQELLAKVIGKTLKADTRSELVSEAEYVIFVTGTPVDEHLNPKVNDVLQVIDQYLPLMRNDQYLILRSTLFPGVSELIWKHVRAEKRGINVAFCPERVAQGLAIEEIQTLPQIVSAFSLEVEDQVAELFSLVAPEILRMTPKEAELLKLFANSWRYIQFAIANQFYAIAEGCGIDFNRIHRGLTYNYPRANDFKRPGFSAGPCLFKDTMQLSAFFNNNYFLGHSAMLVNEGMPNILVQKLERQLGNLEGKKIGLLGMAFKPNHDDTRDSLSYKLKKSLEMKMAIVFDTDVYQPTHARLDSILKTADAFILGVPHREYLNLDLGGKPYVDCWGAWDPNPNLHISPFVRDSKAASTDTSREPVTELTPAIDPSFTPLEPRTKAA